MLAIFALVLGAVSLISRSALFQYGDSATFYYEGLLLSRGAAPFVDFVDNKNPGIYLLLALPARVWGWDMGAGVLLFRILDVLLMVCTLRLVSLVRGGRTQRMLVAIGLVLAYTGCFPNPRETFYTETPEAILGALACGLYLRGGSSFGAGLAIGTAVIFRQTALVDLVIIAAHRLFLRRAGAEDREGACATVFRLMLGAVCLPALLMVLAARGGWLADWWRHAYIWNRDYAAAFPPFYTRIPAVLGSLLGEPSTLFLALLALAGALLVCSGKNLAKNGDIDTGAQELLPRLRARGSLEFFLLDALALHLAEAAGSGIFYRHHLIPLLPALAMLALYFLAFARRLETSEARSPGAFLLHSLLVLPLCIVLGAASLTTIDALWRERAARLHDIEYAGEWVASHSRPDEKILAWGLRSELYLASRRFAASAFHHNLSLTNQSRAFEPIDPQFIERFRSDLAANPPRFIFLFGDEDAYEDLSYYFPEAKTAYSRQTLKVPGGRFDYLERAG